MSTYQEGRAVLLDDGAGGVDEGEAVGHGVLGEAVLLGQEARRLVDDRAQVAHVLLGELAPHGRQVDGAARLLEGAVHRVVGDARRVRPVRGGRRGTAEGSPRLTEGGKY